MKKGVKEEEVELLDGMFSVLVELLEEKGIITEEEWEARIKKRLQESKGLRKFRELEP